MDNTWVGFAFPPDYATFGILKALIAIRLRESEILHETPCSSTFDKSRCSLVAHYKNCPIRVWAWEYGRRASRSVRKPSIIHHYASYRHLELPNYIFGRASISNGTLVESQMRRAHDNHWAFKTIELIGLKGKIGRDHSGIDWFNMSTSLIETANKDQEGRWVGGDEWIAKFTHVPESNTLNALSVAERN